MVALDDNQSGEGWLFWDDGESLATYEAGAYTLLHFIADKVSFSINATHWHSLLYFDLCRTV